MKYSCIFLAIFSLFFFFFCVCVISHIEAHIVNISTEMLNLLDSFYFLSFVHFFFLFLLYSVLSSNYFFSPKLTIFLISKNYFLCLLYNILLVYMYNFHYIRQSNNLIIFFHLSTFRLSFMLYSPFQIFIYCNLCFHSSHLRMGQ